MTGRWRISLAAVAIGAAADLAVSLTFGMMLGVVLVGFHLSRGVPPGDLIQKLNGPEVHIPGAVFGFLSTAVGGYVAGRVANRAELLHAALVGLVWVPVGLLFWNDYPLWYNVAGMAGCVPAALAGGGIALLHRRFPARQPAEADD